MKKKFSGFLAVIFFMICLPDMKAWAVSLSEINGYKTQICELMEDCAARGIPTDYEEAALAIIERYSDELAENPVMEEYVLSSLKRICERTITDLTGYLKGKKQASASVSIKDSQLETKDKSFFGTVLKDGETLEKTVFLNGVGHWKQVRNDLDFFEKTGINFVQTEVSMSEVLKEPFPADDWEIVRQQQDTASVSRSTDSKYRGDYSLCITKTDTEWKLNKLTAVHQKVTVEPSTKYKYTFFVKRKNAEYFWFSLKGRSRDADCYINLSTTGEDAKMVVYSGEYTTGEDETELDLTFVNESVAEYIYIDYVFLRKDGNNTNLVKNPSFEELSDSDFRIDNGVVSGLRSFLEEAAEHNVKVDLLVSPHNEPEFMLGLYPELKYNGYGFFKYDPLLPMSQEIIKKYLQGLCTGIKDCTALNSICLSNEPAFNTYYEPERYNPLWQKWLKSKYGDIDSLNKIYNSKYSGFDELNLEEIQKMNKDQRRKAIYKDYKNFNEALFAQWHTWIASVVKELIPNVFVHCKAVNYLGIEDTSLVPRNITFNCANYELLNKVTDINGCDAGGNLETEYQQFVLDMLYDLHGSIKNAPVINSENHIISENSHDAAQYAYSTIWQGAVRGLGASAAWIWDKNYEYAKQEGHYDAILQLKPEHLWQLSRVTMDMNRLSDELSAVQNIKPEIGILYSEAARIYSFTHLNSVYKTYKAVNSVGEKVRFVTDTCYDNLNDLKLLIIPNARSVTDDLLNALKEYKGKLLIIGEHSLTYDDDLKPRVKTEIAQAISKAQTVTLPHTESGYTMITPSVDEIEDILLGYIKDFGREVCVSEAETEDVASDVSWTATTYQGKKIVNICNYGVNPVKLSITGATGWVNLITGEAVSNDFVAKPNVPLLLSETEYVALTKEENYVSKLLPVTPIMKYRNGYKASWVNPDNNHITKISLYKVDKNGVKSCVYNQFSTQANDVCSYHADKTHTDARYFIIEMQFDNAPSTEFVLGGVMRANLGGDWSVEADNGSDTAVCYQFETGYTASDAHSGKYALCYDANYKEYDGSSVSIKAPLYRYQVEEGKNYRVSFRMKSSGVSSVLIKPDVLPQKQIVAKLADVNNFPETRNDWRYYYYDTTAEATAVSENGFELVFDEMANGVVVDDICIYELNEKGEPAGENIFSCGDFEGIDAVDIGTVTNIRREETDNGTVISWDEPEHTAFAAVRLYINGQLAGKIMKGINSISLTSLKEEDVIEICAVDTYGIEDSYYPVEFSQNGISKKEIKAGDTYEVSADMTEGILYIGFYGVNNELCGVISAETEAGATVTVPENITHMKTFIWNEDLHPLTNARKWNLK